MPQKTLADTLAARETLYVNCAHPMCGRSTKLDIQALIDQFGATTAQCMTTVRVFGCSGKLEPNTWNHPEGEPLLSWCENHGNGVMLGEPADDREGNGSSQTTTDARKLVHSAGLEPASA